MGLSSERERRARSRFLEFFNEEEEEDVEDVRGEVRAFGVADFTLRAFT